MNQQSVVTITDNRDGSSFEIPIVNGSVDAAMWRRRLPGVVLFDPALDTTAVTSSAVTMIDEEHRVRCYRGLPVIELALASTYAEVAYLLINGDLPSVAEYEPWAVRASAGAFIHENVRKRFLNGFHHDAPPLGMLVSAVAALSTFRRTSHVELHTVEHRRDLATAVVFQMPALAAACHRHATGLPYVQPDPSRSLAAN